MILILFGAQVALALGTAVVLLLRTFLTTRISHAETLEPVDLLARDYRPMRRLLDPTDLDYLRRKGISAARIKKLRSERRRIYRLGLQSLTRDFHCVHSALSLILVQAQSDRRDLAAQLARQRIAFHRNLIVVEFRLILHACGIDHMPAVDLLGPLEILQGQLRQLTPVGAAA